MNIRALLPLGCMLLVSFGCDSKKPDPKDAAGKSDAKQDAKADEKSDAKKEDAKSDAKPKAPVEPRSELSKKFRKGQIPKPGMTPEEIKAFAEAQGDPQRGDFTLAEALAGDEVLADASKGKLTASFETTKGAFACELFEGKAPKTVANFVGLARGVRESYDKKSDAWTAKKFYDGVIFHRVKAGFMVQTGDPSGSGSGGPGYVIEEELDSGLKHNKAGTLSMANLGPGTGNSQFFITVAKTPHLNGKHTIFGSCDPAVATEISKVKVDPRRNDRPYEQIKITSVTISRK